MQKRVIAIILVVLLFLMCGCADNSYGNGVGAPNLSGPNVSVIPSSEPSEDKTPKLSVPNASMFTLSGIDAKVFDGASEYANKNLSSEVALNAFKC